MNCKYFLHVQSIQNSLDVTEFRPKMCIGFILSFQSKNICFFQVMAHSSPQSILDDVAMVSRNSITDMPSTFY